MIAQVAKAFGISPLRQMRDVFSMRGGVQKLAGWEFYSLRLFDPAKTKTDKSAFVGNKLLFTQLLTQLGIASARTQALVSGFREVGALRTLRDAGRKAEALETHPRSGAQVVGAMLPHWDETLKIAFDAHAVFPEFGICGFDIAVTADGPKVLECNDNPSHMLYQIAAGRGLVNPNLAPIWQAVSDRQTKQVARLKAAAKTKR